MELKTRWGDCEVYLHVGDITTLAIDAIVNAANPDLTPGGGISGAIHGRGGPAIREECEILIAQRGGPLARGEAVITTAGHLPARYVIQAAGPVYRENKRDESARLLGAVYRNCLKLLRDRGLRSIAFPCVSAGHYGYASNEACEIAIRTVKEEILQHGECSRVVFCTFDMMDTWLYQRASFDEHEMDRGTGKG
jgi:O-acetyl-ADP-ribose deacetylase (regulator of RNase III)